MEVIVTPSRSPPEMLNTREAAAQTVMPGMRGASLSAERDGSPGSAAPPSDQDAHFKSQKHGAMVRAKRPHFRTQVDLCQLCGSDRITSLLCVLVLSLVKQGALQNLPHSVA